MNSQNHFTLSFPLKSPAAAQLVAQQLPPLMPQLFKAEDTIGTIHYSRFTVLSEKTLLFLADFDGDFGQLMAALGRHSGPLFDLIFQSVDNPPPAPVVDHVGTFFKWIEAHRVKPVTVFSPYPGVTAGELKAFAWATGVEDAGEPNPFLVILPVKSGFAFMELQILLRARALQTQIDLATVGTPHFAQFIPLENNQIGFFTVYDGSFDKFVVDLTKYAGPVFDLIFKFAKNPPQSPCRKHVQSFVDFAAGVNHSPIGFYRAYPGLSVQDINILIGHRRSRLNAA
jgi:hypothetical protein